MAVSADLHRSAADAVTIERELRRACRIVSDVALDRTASWQTMPRPLPPAANHFAIKSAQTGSLNLLLDVIGPIRDILLSDPIQVFLALQALLDNASRLIVRSPNSRDRVEVASVAPPTVYVLERDRDGLTTEVGLRAPGRITINLDDGTRIELEMFKE